MAAITRVKGGGTRLDVIELAKELKAGALTVADRATAERICPGICSRIEQGQFKPESAQPAGLVERPERTAGAPDAAADQKEDA